MSPRRLNPFLASGFVAILLAVAAAVFLVFVRPAQTAASECAQESRAEPPPALALMTSLPIYWPLGADVSDLAAGGERIRTWQKVAISPCYTLVPVDTLAPVPGLSPQEPEFDPLAGHTRLAVIQPRGLSPQDNVALDDWVRAGGTLLIVLDPALSGHYELPLGDPRLPTLSALIPPVIDRWGLKISFDETQEIAALEASVEGFNLPLVLSGQVSASNDDCTILANGAMARCSVGKGVVTVLADAAVFEHEELTGGDSANLIGLLEYAFEQR